MFSLRSSPRSRRGGARLVAAALLACAALLPGCDDDPLVATDVSPDEANGVPADSSAARAGMTRAIVGDDETLYAVSCNAGVWKSRQGGPWRQLASSPGRAYSIAGAGNQLAVGTREGDSIDRALDKCGVYETADGGATWTYSLDPVAAAGAPSHAVVAVAYGRKEHTLVAALANGIAVKPAGGSWQFPQTMLGSVPITAVTASESKLWARDAAGNLIVANDDASAVMGSSWTKIAAAPGAKFLDDGDTNSLAAWDAAAFMVSLGDTTPDHVNNFSKVLVYEVARGGWSADQRIFDPGETTNPDDASRNGTGASGVDGTRFVRAAFWVTGAATEPWLLFGSGQEVFLALTRNASTGLPNWTRIAGTGASSAPLDAHFGPAIHADIWDCHIAPDGNTAWIACDGGVFRIDLRGALGGSSMDGWRKQNQGLHTHHAHTVVGCGSIASAVAYATQDNDGWFFDPIDMQDWDHTDTGDNNIALNDSVYRTHYALLIRDDNGNNLVGYGHSIPDQDLSTPTNRIGYPGVHEHWRASTDAPISERFTFIQSLANDVKTPPDAVMLVDLPFQYKDAGGQLQTIIHGSGPAVVRNQQWIDHPDVDAGQGAGWTLMANALPQDASRIWVSGGHASPVLFVLAVHRGGTVSLYRGDGKLPTSWTDIGDATLDAGAVIHGGNPFYGPIFANPYDPNVVYALTRSGVRVWNGKTGTWTDEAALTDFVTGRGRYRIGIFDGGSWDLVKVGSRAAKMSTLGCIAFDPDSNAVAASSPFTGVVYNNGDGHWHDLTYLLPAPLPSVSSVFIEASNRMLVATEGRGVFRIAGLAQVK